ncbi:hypothetical protein ACR79B_20740 [Sphingobacterium spiritivorum]|uniref:hypothetical protein n=1 Tax=Sphingobacterium spiritivorum TaxID=258 RepID=UPI003DA45D8A
MDLSQAIRESIYQAISSISVDGFPIPVFDGVVNPNVTIPIIRSASTYIVLQGQQDNPSGIQNMCIERVVSNITIRIVTKFTTSGVTDRTLGEKISDLVQHAIRPNRSHNLISNHINIQRVDFPIITQSEEFAGGQTAFSKILIYSITLNKK